jgi:hypothetical protein
MHAAGVIHRDLNPANLLVNAACDLKIADFGLARPRASSSSAQNGAAHECGPMSAYVVTRWYRAPELLLSAQTYDTGVDTWAAGAVLAELLGRRALFPGRDAVHQLTLVLGVVGTPAPEVLARVASPAAAAFAARLPRAARVELQHLYPDAAPDAISLLASLLIFDPEQRCTAEGALRHPYMAAYAEEDDGHNADGHNADGHNSSDGHNAGISPARVVPPAPVAFEFEGQRLEEGAARALVIAEIDALCAASDAEANADANADAGANADARGGVIGSWPPSPGASPPLPQQAPSAQQQQAQTLPAEDVATARARAVAAAVAGSAAAVSAAAAAAAAADAAVTAERLSRRAAAAAAAVIAAAGAAAAAAAAARLNAAQNGDDASSSQHPPPQSAPQQPPLRSPRSPEPPFPAPPKQRSAAEGASRGVVLQPRQQSRSPPPPASPLGDERASSPLPQQLAPWAACAAA